MSINVNIRIVIDQLRMYDITLPFHVYETIFDVKKRLLGQKYSQYTYNLKAIQTNEILPENKSIMHIKPHNKIIIITSDIETKKILFNIWSGSSTVDDNKDKIEVLPTVNNTGYKPIIKMPLDDPTDVISSCNSSYKPASQFKSSSYQQTALQYPSYQPPETKPIKVIEEKVKETPNETKDKIIKFNSDIIKKFSNPLFQDLMKIYKEDENLFIDFMKYLSCGDLMKPVYDNDIEPTTEMIKEIRETFPNSSKFSDEELYNLLKEYNCIINLLIPELL